MYLFCLVEKTFVPFRKVFIVLALLVFSNLLTLQVPETRAQGANEGVKLHQLANTFLQLGIYPDAESHYLRAHQIFETYLGKEHEYVAVNLASLAKLYQVQAKFLEAEPLFKRAISIAEKHYGKEHSYVEAYLVSTTLLNSV